MRKDYQKTQRDGQPTAEDRALEKFTDLMIDKLQNLQQDWQSPGSPNQPWLFLATSMVVSIMA